jgi:hypothetical protein
MKDAFEAELYVQDFVVYVTLTGHKPILTRATVLEAEADRVKVQPLARSIGGWRAPDALRVRWLHQPENVVKVSMNV